MMGTASPIGHAEAVTSVYDAEILGLNKRQLTARVLTMEQEQARREHLLEDSAKVADYAVDKGLSAGEMRALLQSNHANNTDRLARYKEVLAVMPDDPRAQIGWKELDSGSPVLLQACDQHQSVYNSADRSS